MHAILIVDDEPDFTEAVKIVLNASGHCVFVATNGQDAIDCLRNIRPDIVILDLMMPIMSGPATLELMRKSPTTTDIPVLLISNLPEKKAREFTTRYDAFLRKPFAINDMMKAMGSLLGDKPGQ